MPTLTDQHVPTSRTPDLPTRFPARSALRVRLRSLRQFVEAHAAVPVHRLSGRRSPGFGILMYHRVAWDTPGATRSTWNVNPRRFEEQLSGLLSRGFQAWPLQRAIEVSDSGQSVPDNVFVVTFDDGYHNVHQYAWPILQRLAVPATIFVSTAFLDTEQPFPFEDWRHAGSSAVPRDTWLPLTTAQCHEMLADPLIEIGSHTHTHRDFRQAPHLLYEDLVQSREVLQQEFGIERSTFSFPWGTTRLGFSGGPMTAAARRAGLRCSLTTESQLVRPGSDPFQWGRFIAEGWDTPATLAAKLTGNYRSLRDLLRVPGGSSSTSGAESAVYQAPSEAAPCT